MFHDDSSLGDEFFVTIHPDGFESLNMSPKINDFLFVKFTGKSEKNKIYFIGQILKENELGQSFDITYLRNQKKGRNKFIFLYVADESVVSISDIKIIMPPPILCGHTSRRRASFSFESDFSLLDIR